MSRGHERERAVKRLLESQDYWVARAAGSFGDADLVALRAGQKPMLVEVKSTAGGPYEHFGPKDRAALSLAAKIAGAHAVLCWWPPRRDAIWLYENAWPSVREKAACGSGEEY